MLQPSSGRVLICGLDLSAKPWHCALRMGICPQHDTLWSTLTAREHLLCYGRIKGLPSVITNGDDLEGLRSSVERCLEAVGLIDVADKPCHTYRCGPDELLHDLDILAYLFLL